MALRLVRESSDVPNISNKDDVTMIRYAYGGYNGVVQGFGNELNYDASVTGEFRIQSGRVVLDGWEVDILSNGWAITDLLTSGNYFYVFYLQVDALNETATINSMYGLSAYPDINEGDDLTEVPNGIARLPLYKLELNNGVVVNVEKLVETIPYANNHFLPKSVYENAFEPDNQTVKKAANSATANIANYSKGIYPVFVFNQFTTIEANTSKEIYLPVNVTGNRFEVSYESEGNSSILYAQFTIVSSDGFGAVTYPIFERHGTISGSLTFLVPAGQNNVLRILADRPEGYYASKKFYIRYIRRITEAQTT